MDVGGARETCFGVGTRQKANPRFKSSKSTLLWFLIIGSVLDEKEVTEFRGLGRKKCSMGTGMPVIIAN